jgi:hypothetical protein
MRARLLEKDWEKMQFADVVRTRAERLEIKEVRAEFGLPPHGVGGGVCALTMRAPQVMREHYDDLRVVYQVWRRWTRPRWLMVPCGAVLQLPRQRRHHVHVRVGVHPSVPRVQVRACARAARHEARRAAADTRAQARGQDSVYHHHRRDLQSRQYQRGTRAAPPATALADAHAAQVWDEDAIESNPNSFRNHMILVSDPLNPENAFVRGEFLESLIRLVRRTVAPAPMTHSER